MESWSAIQASSILFLSLTDFHFSGNLKMTIEATPCCFLVSRSKKRKIRTLHFLLKKISGVLLHTFPHALRTESAGTQSFWEMGAWKCRLSSEQSFIQLKIRGKRGEQILQKASNLCHNISLIIFKHSVTNEQNHNIETFYLNLQPK